MLSHVQLCDRMHCSSPGSSAHGEGKNAGVGCRFLLQGIFPTQGSKMGLQHCTICKYEIITLYTLNLYNVICQLYLNKVEEKQRATLNNT